MKRKAAWLALIFFLLVLTQSATWLAIGNTRLAPRLAKDAADLTNDELIIDHRSLSEVPEAIRRPMLEMLQKKRIVFLEEDLPTGYSEVAGKTSRGEEIIVYRRGRYIAFRVSTNPLLAKARVVLYSAPLSAKIYQFWYVWILGSWVRVPTDNPIGRS